MSSPQILIFTGENNNPNDVIQKRDEMDIFLDTTFKECDKYEDIVTPENFNSFLSTVNEKISMHGFPGPISLGYSPNNVIVLDCLNRMVIQREKDMIKIENQDYENRKLICDSDNVMKNLKTLEKKHNQALCELDNVREKARGEIQKEKIAKDKITRERDNVTVKLREIKSKCSQYGLKIAQTEKTLDATKERLSRMMNDKSGMKNGMGLTVLSLKKNLGDDYLSQATLKTLQDEKSEMAFENFELRKTLKEINVRLDTIRVQNDIELHVERIKDGMFDLPISMAKEEIKNNLEKRIQQIKEDMDKKKNRPSLYSFKKNIDDDFKKLIDDLEEQVVLQERTIQDQGKIILYTMSELRGQSNYFTNIKESIQTPLKTPTKRKSEGRKTTFSPITPKSKRKDIGNK